MTELNDTQRAALKQAHAQRPIPAITASKLITAGLVEKAGGSGRRGYSLVKLTDKGRAALAS